ncbi:MAG TPA: TolC family protein [Acidobacteriota bacterium]|nr:TolC family protein [Acidobacteriota bacterium]
MKSGFVLAMILSLAVLGASAGHAQAPSRITLKEAESIALANHPRLQAAQLSALAAGQEVTQARSAYFPMAFGSMTGAGALDRSRFAAGGLNNPIIFDRYADGFMASQLITDFGRTGNLVASTRLRAQAKNADTITTRADVLLQVDRAYYAELRATSVLRVAQETVADRQLVVDQVTALAKSKLKSDLDVSFANVNLAEAKLILVQVENDLKAAGARLTASLGFNDERDYDLADEPLPAAPLPDLPQAVAQALRDRPELASRRLQRDSAERFAKAEKDLWRPSVSVLGGAGIVPIHDSNLLNRFAGVGLNINIPVFNGHLFSALSTEARFNFQSEAQNVRDLEDTIARDVRLAWMNADTAFQRLGLTQQLLDQASLALDLAQARYKLGLGSIVELSQAQLNKTQAEIEQASAKYEYQTQRAVFAYEIGALR